MNNYELMTIFRPDLEEQPLQEAVERVSATIAARGGEVISTDPWGRRRLAYPIQDFRDGLYQITQLKLNAKAVDELERSLMLNDQVIRYLLLRVE